MKSPPNIKRVVLGIVSLTYVILFGKPIVDDAYPDDTGNSTNPYAYRRLYIAPGPQHL